MTEHTPGIPLGSWLADLPDDQLILLLELRPDLAQPPPASIAALAARAQARQSVRAATDELDFLRLAVIDALLVLHADVAPVPVAKLLGLIGKRVPESDVTGALDDLHQRALVWGDTVVRVAADAAAGLPWHPGQVTLEDVSRSGEQLNEQITQLDEAELAVLDKLLQGSPMGRSHDAAPGAPPDRPVPRLLAAGLLRQVDAETVILHRQVGQLLRGEEPGPLELVAPDPVVSTTTPTDADAAAAGAVIDLMREFDVVLQALSAAPVPELRSGGLGVREVKRLAKVTGIDEQRLGVVLEIAAAAGLIANGMLDSAPSDGQPLDGPHWAPTLAADRFADTPTAERWHLLASTWLDLPARPGLIGHRGPDAKPYGALSDSIYSTAAPLDRQLLLRMLADLPAGAGVDQKTASAALVWRRPRWSRRLQPGPVADLLAEAHALGLVGRGAISTPARALLGEESDTAVDAMARALPKPIDHFLVQADLTVVAPGPLERELAEQLATVATVESAGAAMVYRVSEQSIRHSLDIGRTAGSLHAFFQKHSKTPVPQGLTYLINDVARRHGQLRIGMAASFIRSEDPALLAQAAAITAAEHIQLRVLAPTVAVSQAPIAEVLAVLRDAGFAPAAEDSSGSIVDIRSRGARMAMAQQRRPPRALSHPSSETLSALIAVLRKVTAAPFANIRVDPAVAMSLLQRAIRQDNTVVIGYVDAAGVATQRVVSPISLRGGQLLAFDSTSERPREFAVHRITSVVRAGDDAERSDEEERRR